MYLRTKVINAFGKQELTFWLCTRHLCWLVKFVWLFFFFSFFRRQTITIKHRSVWQTINKTTTWCSAAISLTIQSRWPMEATQPSNFVLVVLTDLVELFCACVCLCVCVDLFLPLGGETGNTMSRRISFCAASTHSEFANRKWRRS